MSPLIDVTNTGGQNCLVPDKICKEITKKGSAGLQRNKSLEPDGFGQSGAEEGIARRSQGKLGDNQLKAIKMCNTRTRSSAGNESSHKGSLKGITSGQSVVDPMRVPPLPQTTTADDVLSQAVQALSLNPLTAHTKPSTTRLNRRHHKLGYAKQNGRRDTKVTASSSGLPESTDGTDVVRTPLQCGACGLEFTSLPVLTQHLAKHVYDGLYAAQWLTQAMTLVSSRQPTSEALDAPVDSVPNNDDDSLLSQSTQPCSSVLDH